MQDKFYFIFNLQTPSLDIGLLNAVLEETDAASRLGPALDKNGRPLRNGTLVGYYMSNKVEFIDDLAKRNITLAEAIQREQRIKYH